MTQLADGIEQDWEPWDYDDPAGRLILQVKSLRTGGTLKLARGVTVSAKAVPHGSCHVRRYFVGTEMRKSATEAAHLAVERSKAAGGKNHG
jgi:hypothetical protein